MIYLSLLGGLALLILGGEALVRGAVAAAERLRVSPLLIGMTLVGFGTSVPELVTSVKAALIDAPGVAIGNVVGSNTANILLILGVAALLTPLAIERRGFLIDIGVFGFAALACAVIVAADALGRPAGAALILCLAIYLGFAYRRGREEGLVAVGEALAPHEAGRPLAFSLMIAAAGIGATILGAHLLVEASVDLARAFGVSEALIGVTIVAIGTSLPELATSAVAAYRRQSDIAFGNVLGSNIFNVFAILGATALIRPIPVPGEIARIDVWVMLGATIALAVAARTQWRLSRGEGAVLLGAYLVYVAARAA